MRQRAAFSGVTLQGYRDAPASLFVDQQSWLQNACLNIAAEPCHPSTELSLSTTNFSLKGVHM
jgi:hypothetical protein